MDRGITYKECAKSHPLGSPQWCKTDKKEALTESFKSFGICHSACDSVKGKHETYHHFFVLVPINLLPYFAIKVFYNISLILFRVFMGET